MAKVTGVATQLSGKVGQLIYRQTKYGTVVYEAPSKASVPQRTEAQMQIRTQWGNMAAIYRQFNQTLKKGFEGLNGKMNDYNAFIQANTNVVKVYVPKSVRLNGGSVLAPYQITRGSLPSIAMHVGEGGALVSDLNVGSLVIGAETSVADFANALIAYNDGYEAGDQVTFFYGQQTVDAVTGIPRARIYGFKVMLNPGDSTPLWEVVSALGFSSVGGFVGMDRAIEDGAAVWVHSREDGTGGVKCSTQFLYVDSSLLAGYQTAEAMEGAANSYGGINASAVYLNPRSSGRVGAVTVVPSVPSGGNGTQNSQNSQNGGDNSGGSSNTGGGSEQTVTVAAPTITGDSTFADTGTVNISAESGAEIHYTLDGSAPTSASALYSGSITLTDTTTVKAVAVKDGVTSEVASMTFTKSSAGGDGTDFD
jgi:hypothetical protein